MTVHARITTNCIIFLAAIFSGGCHMHRISWNFPDYETTNLESVPDRVLASFTRTYPQGQIENVASLVWPPSGNTHFRFEFLHEGELWEAEFREDGSLIEGRNQPVKQGENQDLPSVATSPFDLKE